MQDYCTGQCWYDNVVYTPAGYPDVVYLLGSFSYGQLGGVSNGRAVLLSSDAGATWSDLTQDGDPTHAEFTHPDQHAIVTMPGNPYLYWEGSDGGIVSSDGSSPTSRQSATPRGLSAAEHGVLQEPALARAERSWPTTSTAASRRCSSRACRSARSIRRQPAGRNAGQRHLAEQRNARRSGIRSCTATAGSPASARRTTRCASTRSPGQANDANFRNGDPTKWVIISAPIITSPEGAFFYPPVVADPHTANGGTIFQGSFSVWRTQDWGGNQAFLEANCPEFTTSAGQPGCGDFVPIGPPGRPT